MHGSALLDSTLVKYVRAILQGGHKIAILNNLASHCWRVLYWRECRGFLLESQVPSWLVHADPNGFKRPDSSEYEFARKPIGACFGRAR